MKNSRVCRPSISTEAVLRAIEGKDVSVQFDGRGLAILNYTKQAQYLQHWHYPINQCRGLVVKWEPEKPEMPIVIKAPEKFFNKGESHAPDTDKWDWGEVSINEKLDGYYISVRNDSEYGLIVTSRGSFSSRYALAARELLPKNIPQNIDYFCELLQDFPGDESIIVTRHPKPKLLCWGVGVTYDGWILPADRVLKKEERWAGGIAVGIKNSQLEGYLKDRVEGVVLFNGETGERVKVKTDWYLELHRAISGCTFKKVLEIVTGGGSLQGRSLATWLDSSGGSHTLELKNIPEEHLSKMLTWELEIRNYYARVSAIVRDDYQRYKSRGAKAYALESASPADIKGLVFGKMKGRPVREATWDVVRKRLLRNPTD